MFEWGWLIGISVALLAIACIVLVVFLSIALISLRRTLESSNQVLKETKVVIDNLHTKIHAFDSLFKAVSNVGHVVERKVSHATEEIEERERGKAGVITDALEFAILGVTLWQKIKDRRS